MALTLTKDFSKLEELKRKLTHLRRSNVEVGIFEESVYSGSEQGNSKVPTSNDPGTQVAWIASVQEYGSFYHKVPARPFRTETVKAILRDKKRLGLEIEQAITKNVPRATQAMGKRFKDMMHMIVDSWVMRDSNSTLWAEEKGFNKPLEHTGKLLDSIDYRVKAGK